MIERVVSVSGRTRVMRPGVPKQFARCWEFRMGFWLGLLMAVWLAEWFGVRVALGMARTVGVRTVCRLDCLVSIG